uniref:Uncharacterized protein n=1 Tax=Oryza rufipogon TaxID=4529 RepID=A0A0E0QGH6_ORYRU
MHDNLHLEASGVFNRHEGLALLTTIVEGADNQLIFPNVDGLLPEGPEEGEARLISDEILKRMCLILKYITWIVGNTDLAIVAPECTPSAAVGFSSSFRPLPSQAEPSRKHLLLEVLLKTLKNPRQWRRKCGDRHRLLHLRSLSPLSIPPPPFLEPIGPSPFTPEVLAAAEPLHEPPSST